MINFPVTTVRNKTCISKGTQNSINEILVNEIRVDSKGLLTYYLYHLKNYKLKKYQSARIVFILCITQCSNLESYHYFI